MAQRLRLIALNGSAGAFVDVLASGATRGIEFMEDEAGATQGIQVKTFVDNFATTSVFSFGSEPIQIPNFHKVGDRGPLLGLPEQNKANGVAAPNYRAADKLISAKSNGAAGTTLRFIEYD